MSEKPLTPSESPRVNGEPSERWKTRPPREWGNEELLDGFGCLCKESGPCVEHERLIPKEVYAEIVRRMRESCVVTVTTEAQPPVCNRQTMYCRVAHDGAAAVQRMGQAIPSDPAAMAAMPETPAEIRAMRNITLAVCRALPSIEHKLAGPIADLFTTVDAWMDLARARTGGAKVETSIGPIRVTAEETSEPPPPCDMCGAPAAKQLVSRDGGTVTRCDAHREDRSANPLNDENDEDHHIKVIERARASARAVHARSRMSIGEWSCIADAIDRLAGSERALDWNKPVPLDRREAAPSKREEVRVRNGRRAGDVGHVSGRTRREGLPDVWCVHFPDGDVIGYHADDLDDADAVARKGWLLRVSRDLTSESQP